MAKAKEEPSFFGPDALRFLGELAKHNERAWFQANKARYETSVQAPALRFIEAMGPRLGTFSRHLVADPKPFGGSLGRIYRDTRFAKDKSPYKTHIGIHFFHEGAAGGENLPGFYFHLAPGESMVASGIWHPEPPALRKIRDSIVGSPATWGKVLGGGLEIGGDSLVRVPPGYDADHRFAVDLRRKDFYASRSLSDPVVSGPGLAKGFESACRDLDPLNRFLAKALDVPW